MPNAKASPPPHRQPRNARAADRVRAELRSLRAAASERLARRARPEPESEPAQSPRFAKRPRPL